MDGEGEEWACGGGEAVGMMFAVGSGLWDVCDIWELGVYCLW